MVPVIDIDSLLRGKNDTARVAQEIGNSCRDSGFFYITKHGIPEVLITELERLSREFFAKNEKEKLEIAMSRANRAWRGYFPVGQELTSGKPDQKEGIYFGSELPPHPTLPLHGPNLFPGKMPRFKPVVREYLEKMTQLGHSLMKGLSLSLGLDGNYFWDHYTKDPLILFRIFNYPGSSPTVKGTWGVGEHTDYGVLTILKQDDCGGLEIRTKNGWLPAPPLPGTFVCNIGDMLDRMTGGIYRSTPHRVQNVSGRDRLSLPFFFDPNFNAEVKPLPISPKSIQEDKDQRWDKKSVHAFQGTYGEYLLGKVSKVFPELSRNVLAKD